VSNPPCPSRAQRSIKIPPSPLCQREVRGDFYAKARKEKGFILVIVLFLLLLLAATAMSLNYKTGLQTRMAVNRTLDAQTYLDQLAVIERSLWELMGDPSWRVPAGENYAYQGRTYSRKVFGPDTATYPALSSYQDAVIIAVQSPNSSIRVSKTFRYNIDTPFLIRKPRQVGLDSAGNIFFADYDNHSIWKIDVMAGAILRIAGRGPSGFSGDGGPAIQAQLNSPCGVCVDALGNVYIADTNNHRIRKFTVGGNISTVAGTGTGGYNGEGLAAAAQINSPSGVAVDASGNIYIADTNNHRIRKFTVGGNISTVAGTGSAGSAGDGGQATAAQLNSPSGVAVDISGNIYIADTNNQRIRKFTVGGTISTVAGTGTAGYSGEGVATSAQINSPSGVAVDASGNIYIADTNNQRIRKFTVGGNISTVAGTGTAGYSGDGGMATSALIDTPRGLAVKSTGEVIIADTGNSCLRQVAAAIISTLPMTAGPGLTSPQGVATYYDTAQKKLFLYIADQGNHRIRKLDLATNAIVTVAGTGTATVPPGPPVDNILAANTTLNSPAAVALDASGNLYIADTGNNLIRKVTAATGIITTIAGGGSGTGEGNRDPSKVQLSSPSGVFADTQGNIYIADTGNNKIRKVTAGNIDTIVDNSGNGGFSGDGGLAPSARISLPTGVFVDSLNNVYIADRGNHCIRKVNASNNVINTVAGIGTNQGYSGDGGAATAARLISPNRVSVDPAGNIYIADTGNHALRMVNHATIPTISTIAGTGTSGYNGDMQPAVQARLWSPGGVTLGLTKAGGRIYIGDAGNNRVRVLFLKTEPQVYGP